MPFKDPIKKKEYERKYYEINKERMKQRAKNWREKNLEKVRQFHREYNRKNKDKLHNYLHNYYLRVKNTEKYKKQTEKSNKSPMHKVYHLHWRERLRFEILSHYSNGTMRCACPPCGESIIEFLELDHINNDGAKQKREGLKSTRLWTWIKKNNFPEGYQVLCANCNRGKYINRGICPHQLLRDKS